MNQTDWHERAFLDEPLQRPAGISRLPRDMAITWRLLRDFRIALQAFLT